MSIWDTWAADPRYAQVIGDPRFLQSTPAYKSQIHDILFKYGFTGTPDQMAAAGGPVENNPYSVANLLKRSQQDANHSTINTANAAGLEESGAAVGGLNANTENYKRGVSEAVAQMGGELTGAQSDYTNTINSIFGDVEQNPVVTGQPDPLTGSIGGSAGAPAPGGREIDRPGVQTNPWHVPAASWVAPKIKKVVGPQNRGLPGYR